MNMEMQGGTCTHMHHKWISILVVLFGLTFLLGDWNVFTQSTVNIVWPILVILAGLAKMKHHHCCKHMNE